MCSILYSSMYSCVIDHLDIELKYKSEFGAVSTLTSFESTHTCCRAIDLNQVLLIDVDLINEQYSKLGVL